MEINTGTPANPSQIVTAGGYTFALSVNAASELIATVINPFTITGPLVLTIYEGYAATSIDSFNVTGAPTPTVTVTSGDPKITWNNTTMKLEIAPGLPLGTYPVTLTAGNGVSPDATFSFTLLVIPAGAPEIEMVSPGAAPNISDIASVTNINIGDLEYVGGKLFVTAGLANAAASDAGIGAGTVGKIVRLPVVSVDLRAPGNIAGIIHSVRGSDLATDSLADVSVLKVLSSNSSPRGELFQQAGVQSGFGDKKFMISSTDGVIWRGGKVFDDDIYLVVTFVQDGGPFDLDGTRNRIVVDPLAMFVTSDGEQGGGGGCSAMTANVAAYGCFIFAVGIFMARYIKKFFGRG